jgi:Protein of unknown function (DUF2934)
MNNTHDSPANRPTDPQSLASVICPSEVQKAAGMAREEVAKKAYTIYQARGCPQGQDLQHWFAAEAQVIAARKLSRQHK